MTTFLRHPSASDHAETCGGCRGVARTAHIDGTRRRSAQIAPLTRTLEVLLVAPPERPPRAVEPTPPARPEPVTRKPRAVRPAPQQPSEALEAPREPAPVALPEAAPPLTEPAPAIATRPPEPAPVAAVAMPSPALLAEYGNSVSTLLARHREYPRVALMRGWEGTVTLRLRVAPGGS
jgi:protein TonB